MAKPTDIAALRARQWDKLRKTRMLPVDKLTLAIALYTQPEEVLVWIAKYNANVHRHWLCLVHYAEQYVSGVAYSPEVKRSDAAASLLRHQRKNSHQALLQIMRYSPERHVEFCWVCQRIHKLGLKPVIERGR